MTIWRMRISRQVRKATNKHSYHVTRIAFPLQQWLHERASLLRYTYSTLPVLFFLGCLSAFPFFPWKSTGNIRIAT